MTSSLRLLLYLILLIAIFHLVDFGLSYNVEHRSSQFPSLIAWIVSKWYSTTCTTPTSNPTEYAPGVSLNIGTVNGTRNKTAPYLPGLLFEDIAHSGDGGIYAELIRNRAFQGSAVSIGSGQPYNLPGKVITEAENPVLPFAPTLDSWYPVGNVRLSLDLLHPLSDALQTVLQVDVPLDAEGEVGVKNDGWWGMAVSPQMYDASFYAQANGVRWNATLTHFDISLRDNRSDEVFASQRIDLDKSNAPVPWMYNHYHTQIPCNATAPSTHNAFALTMSADEARGQTFYLTLLSLFPETYKSRPNGLRPDLASPLEAANFRFLRFPGGNNLEGYSIQRRWKWWQTLGPLQHRPGRVGDWSYFNTDGLGLMEFMQWCEDMELVPVLGVYAGFSLDVANWDAGNSSDANEVPEGMMGWVLREALEELEFLMGDRGTYWGGKRAALGREMPWEVPFVEIGNEDFFSHNYPARAQYMYEGLRAKYPNITYIYSAGGLWPEQPLNITLPNATIWDEHIYAPPQTFINHFNQFDNWHSETGNPDIYASILEYHAGGGHPSMHAAVAEGVYALGWERNPHTVRLACFAPLIQNRNVWRGTPYLALFDADPARTVLSASFWQEWLFNRFRGEETVEVEGEEGFGPVFWVGSWARVGGREVVYLKVVNAGEKVERLSVMVDVQVEKVNGTTVHADDPRDKDAFNDVGEERIVPRRAEGLEIGEDGMVGWWVPPWSVSVLQLDLEGRELGKDEEAHMAEDRPLGPGLRFDQEVLR